MIVDILMICVLIFAILAMLLYCAIGIMMLIDYLKDRD